VPLVLTVLGFKSQLELIIVKTGFVTIGGLVKLTNCPVVSFPPCFIYETYDNVSPGSRLIYWRISKLCNPPFSKSTFEIGTLKTFPSVETLLPLLKVLLVKSATLEPSFLEK